MDDDKDDENRPWYHDRLMDLEHEGWNIVSIEDFLSEEEELVTERWLYVDFAVELAQELLERTGYLGDAASQRAVEQSEVWEEELRDPMNAERVLEEYSAWAKDWRPWEVILNSALEDWREAGREESYASFMARFDALDISSLPSTLILSPLLSNPEAIAEIDDALSTLETDEQRQRTAISKAGTMLTEAGFDVGELEKMPIIEALNWVSQLHDLHDLHEDLRLLIVEQIALFDPKLAAHHEERRKALIHQTSNAELRNFRLQMDAIADNLHQRLANINDLLNRWREKGIRFPHADSIRPIELLEWETNLPEIEASIHIHMNALERWNQITALWGDEANSGAQYAGVLEDTEQFIDHVDHLDQRWKQYELEAMMIIERYESRGIVMGDWSEEILRDPRSALQQLKNNEQRFQSRLACIDDLLSIDTSFEGEEEVLSRIAVLKEIDVDADVLENTRELVETLAKRGARHRIMLDRDWRELVAQGKADESMPTASFNLREYEDEIGLLRRFGTSLSSSTDGNSIIAGDIHERLKNRTRQELASLESLGWSVSQLLREVESDVVSTAQKIHSFRPHVAAYAQLVRRLTPLPWDRDIELALEVQEQLKDPTQLGPLSEKIPLLVKHLATKKSDGGSFAFEAWQPAPIRQTLVPVPESFERHTMVPKDALGDAHEAILEAMEPEVSTPEPESEGIEEEDDKASEPIDKIELEPVEEVHVEETQIDENLPAKRIMKEPEPLEHVSNPIVYSNVIQFLEAIDLDDVADDVSMNGADALPNVRRKLAKHVGIEPRDMRVDRMLRLALRLLPQSKPTDVSNSELLAKIGGNTKPMKRWMRARLENRHSGSNDVFLDDALNLGKALQRIPGPGYQLPLGVDEYELPNSSETEQLEFEVEQLIALMNLPSAGGIIA
ncbi:MAG: hypothetical protein CBC59_005025 [Euryarchaeota archaeon TMED99]|nr:MAG: hypothetical protein CBC59_005025 [Euryarchaeota archaeon TMED99]